MDDARATDLKACALTDLSDNRIRYARGVLPGSRLPVLVVALRGRIDNHRGGYDHAAAMIVAGLEAWRPAAVVLDFTDLAYTWGDEMLDVLTAPSRWYAGNRGEAELLQIFGERPAVLPVAVVASNQCRDGLVSLIAASPPDLGVRLVDDVGSALAEVDRALTTPA
jgi:hypothetical protein